MDEPNQNQPMNPMPSSPPPMTSMPSASSHQDRKHKMAVWSIFIIVALVVGVLVLWLAKWVDLGFETPSIQTGNELSGEDVLSEIEQIDLGDLDAEFNDIDKDLNSL